MFRDLLLSRDRGRFYETYPFDVRPVTDDRPFFFYTVQPGALWDFLIRGSRASADYKINSALPLLLGLVLVSIVATLVVLSLPPLLFGNRIPSARKAGRSLLFFLFIGAGYVLIQIALIQKFILFLGHPNVRLDGRHFFHAFIERRGKLSEQTGRTRRRGPLAERAYLTLWEQSFCWP